MRPEPLTLRTRWHDDLGREWKIIEKLPFGRNQCITTKTPIRVGEWSSRDIRVAIGKESQAPVRAPTGDSSHG